MLFEEDTGVFQARRENVGLERRKHLRSSSHQSALSKSPMKTLS